jgi:hypothetical protein
MVPQDEARDTVYFSSGNCMTDKPLVIVRWNDAHGSVASSYSEQTIPHAPKRMATVGWLLRDDDAGVAVMGERCEDADDETPWRAHTFVPRGMVISVTPVKRARKKKEPPCPT